MTRREQFDASVKAFRDTVQCNKADPNSRFVMCLICNLGPCPLAVPNRLFGVEINHEGDAI